MAEAGGVQSVDRAVSALEILARQGEAGVSEVAAAIGVHKSTAFRLLGALEARGLVEQAGERGSTGSASGIVRLAGAMTGRLDLTSQGRPVCDRARRASSARRSTSPCCRALRVNLHQVRRRRGPSPRTTGSAADPAARHLERQGPAGARPPGARAQLRGRPDSASPPRTDHRPGGAGRAARRGRGARLRDTARNSRIGLNAMAAPSATTRRPWSRALSVSGPAVPAHRPSGLQRARRRPWLTTAAAISRRMGFLERPA